MKDSMFLMTWNASCGLCSWTATAIVRSRDEADYRAQRALQAHLAAAHALELGKMGKTTTTGIVQ